MGKEPACNAGAAGDFGAIPGSGRSPGKGHGNPFQYSCLGNSHENENLGTQVVNKKHCDEMKVKDMLCLAVS